ncbi:MAG: alpha/beta hydrolase [Magnetospirillum sp. WYHS-4]
MTDAPSFDTPPPSRLAKDDGGTIAYRFTPGKSPGVMFLTGFKSDMEGGKALALEAWARRTGRAFLRFDYTGHGASSGRFEDGCIGDWAADAVLALDRLTEGPMVLVGSSMGGWIMLLTARARPHRIAGLVGIAAAPDFTEDLIPLELSAGQLAIIERDGVLDLPSPYGPEPTPITRKLLHDGRNHLVLRSPLPLTVPVRLIHGMKDPDVPWRTALRIAEALNGTDVEIHLVKEGDHRLSEPRDLERLVGVVESLSARIG